MRIFTIGLIIVLLVTPALACLDSCMNTCCYKYGGSVMELMPGKVNECDKMPGCMLLFLGSVKGSDDVACMQYAGESGSGYNKESIARCMGTCMNECGSHWEGSPSPFSDGPKNDYEEEIPEGVCADVSCPSACQYENNLPALYYDGRCIEDNSTADGYLCGYTKGQCVWKCNSAGTNCEDADPLSVTIDSPTNGARFDTGKQGYVLVDVEGSVASSSSHQISRVTISTTLATPMQANFDSNSNKFSLEGVKITEGKSTIITATAYDSEGRRLGTKTVTVYPSPNLTNLLIKKGGATLWRNGQIIGSDWDEGYNAYETMEGDEFEVHSGETVTIMYSDDTAVVLKGPFRIQYFKNEIKLKKGAIEVEVKHDFRVLGRLGYHVVKGTEFKVIVPEDESLPETLIVMKGTVLSGLIDAPENAAQVTGGQHLYIYPGVSPGADSVGTATAAEMQSFAEGGEVTVPETYGDMPSGSGSCMSAILIFSIFALSAALRLGGRN
ncbi:MAG: hypothetical protein ABH983_05780 [Candidatus Micrarchaeota archaeon]